MVPLVTLAISAAMPLPPAEAKGTEHCPYNPKNKKLNHTRAQVQAWFNEQMFKLRERKEVTMIAVVDGSLHKTYQCGAVAARIEERHAASGRMISRMTTSEYALVVDGCQVELAAIEAALNECKRMIDEQDAPRSPTELHVFTDSTAARACIYATVVYNDKVSHKVIRSVRNSICYLESKQCATHIQWLPSHEGVTLHDEVDERAKQTMKAMVQRIEQGHWQDVWHQCCVQEATLGAFSTLGRVILHKEWNRVWQESDEKHLKKVVQTLPSKQVINSNWGKHLPIMRARLRYGNSALRAHLVERKVITDPRCYQCDTQVDDETVEHFLLDCPTYEDLRKDIQQTYNLPQELSLAERFGTAEFLEAATRRTYVSALDDFIARSGRFRGNETFEVEEILQVSGSGPTRQYLVRWVGDDETKTWEPHDSLHADVPQMVEEFDKMHLCI
jgi:ribonuclease HI